MLIRRVTPALAHGMPAFAFFQPFSRYWNATLLEIFSMKSAH